MIEKGKEGSNSEHSELNSHFLVENRAQKRALLKIFLFVLRNFEDYTKPSFSA